MAPWVQTVELLLPSAKKAAAQAGWRTGHPAEQKPASLSAPHLGHQNWGAKE